GQPAVDYPEASPQALGCGGTRLLADPATGVINSEVVWNETAAGEGASGGGVSDHYALPSWQADAGVPPRVGGSPGSPGAAGGRGGAGGGGHAHPGTRHPNYSRGKAPGVGGAHARAPPWGALGSRLRGG